MATLSLLPKGDSNPRITALLLDHPHESSLFTVANVSSSGLPLVVSGSGLDDAPPVPFSLSGSATDEIKIYLFLVSHWFFLVLPVLFVISHRIALPFLWVLLVHLAMSLPSTKIRLLRIM